MAKSIMHDKKDKTCYLCMLLHEDCFPKVTQEHHVIFGNGRRKLAEKYGLKVNLCISHHTAGKESVHQNSQLANVLKQQAQKDFEVHYPNLDFREIFGRNYIEKDCDGGAEGPEGQQEEGFFFLQ